MMQRLKLTDPDGRVSLTNLAVYVVLALFAFGVLRNGAVSATDLGVLLTALAAYRAKAFQADTARAADADRADASSQRDFESIKGKVAELTKALERERSARTASRSVSLPEGLR